MELREWSLIAFTILSQLSVGTFIALGVAHFFAIRTAGPEEAERLSDRALIAIGPVMVFSLLVSLLHLGNPLNAYRAVANLGSSWLSREVFLAVLFTVAGGAFAILQWRKIGSFAARTTLASVAALIGVGLVYSMANVYLLRTNPVWNTAATPLSFFTTTLLLGVLAVGAAFVANYTYLRGKDPDCADTQCRLLRDALRWIAIAAVALLGAHVVIIPLQLAYLGGSGVAAARAGVEVMYGQYAVLLALRLALVFIGAGLLSIFLYETSRSPGRESVLGNLAYLAFALVLVSEVVGRFLFYATQARVGI